MTPVQRVYLALADVILVTHAAFIAFVVGGLVLIWVGWWRKWTFVRNFRFRAAHLAAIGVVVFESLTGIVCPLTILEDHLRLLAGGHARYAGSFIGHWVHPLIFFDVDETTFTVIYVVFFLGVALSLWVIPPHRQRRSGT
jgi:hypothetical protein